MNLTKEQATTITTTIDRIETANRTLSTLIDSYQLSQAIAVLDELASLSSSIKHLLVNHIRMASPRPFNTSETFKQGLIVHLGITKNLQPIEVSFILASHNIKSPGLSSAQLIHQYSDAIFKHQDFELQNQVTLFDKLYGHLTDRELCDIYHDLIKEESLEIK